MDNSIRKRLEHPSVLLLGFGREGRSTYQLIRRWYPGKKIEIADANPEITDDALLRDDPLVVCHTGRDYLESLDNKHLIIRSPGIPLKDLPASVDRQNITSQTALFLEAYADQTIGVTGTKGKSTTSTLISQMLLEAGMRVLLIGNIGIPAFAVLDQITPETVIVMELSSHQLETLYRAPHIAVLLNLFEEHLDAYPSFRAYQEAKLQIARYQNTQDVLIYNGDDPLVRGWISQPGLKQTVLPFSLEQAVCPGGYTEDGRMVVRLPGKDPVRFGKVHNRYLKGKHQQANILAATMVATLWDLPEAVILNALDAYKGLAHRMEDLGVHHRIRWINDSIATIPEACMAAVRTIPDVDTLILGGFDRGLSMEPLARFLGQSGVRNFILTGDAGRRLGRHLEETIKTDQQLFYIDKFDDFLSVACKHTQPGMVCLLSPAASSYDAFRSFEERGFRFGSLIKGAEGDYQAETIDSGG